MENVDREVKKCDKSTTRTASTSIIDWHKQPRFRNALLHTITRHYSIILSVVVIGKRPCLQSWNKEQKPEKNYEYPVCCIHTSLVHWTVYTIRESPSKIELSHSFNGLYTLQITIKILILFFYLFYTLLFTLLYFFFLSSGQDVRARSIFLCIIRIYSFV